MEGLDLYISAAGVTVPGMDLKIAQELLAVALKEFFARDTYLLIYGVSEMAITHKLAEYLEKNLRKFDIENIDQISVDCEYNRNGEKEKYISVSLHEVSEKLRMHLAGKGEALNPDNEMVRSISTRPDIIVHQRGSNDRNLFIVEVQKDINPDGDEYDKYKLKMFTQRDQNPYHFRYGVFLLFGTGTQPRLLEECWTAANPD